MWDYDKLFIDNGGRLMGVGMPEDDNGDGRVMVYRFPYIAVNFPHVVDVRFVVKGVAHDDRTVHTLRERGVHGNHFPIPYNEPQPERDNQVVGFELYLDNEVEPSHTDSFTITPTQFGQVFETELIVPVYANSISPKVYHRRGRGYQFLGMDLYWERLDDER